MSTTIIAHQPEVETDFNAHATASAVAKSNKGVPAIHGADTPSTTDTRDPIHLALLSQALQKKTEALITRMLAQPTGAQVILWNSGCVQLGNRNVMIRTDDAAIMYSRLQSDERFLLVDMVHLNHEKTEWKATYRCDKALA